MFPSLFFLAVAVFCAASAAYCARKLKEFTSYKAMWLGAVRLLGELDEELRATQEREQALVILAHQLGAERDIQAKRTDEIHRAVAKELEKARAKKLARQMLREEKHFAWIMARRNKS